MILKLIVSSALVFSTLGFRFPAFRETFYYPQDVNAAKFLLKNLDPENWKDKQDADLSLNVENKQPPVIIFGQPEEPKEDQQ